jgi:hypothetical protein
LSAGRSSRLRPCRGPTYGRDRTASHPDESRPVHVRGKCTIGSDDRKRHLDENTIAVAAVLWTAFTGHGDDVEGINELLVRVEKEGA